MPALLLVDFSAQTQRTGGGIRGGGGTGDRIPCEEISTGLLRGKVSASASLAVQTMPTMAVDTVEMTRVPSLISSTCTP